MSPGVQLQMSSAGRQSQPDTVVDESQKRALFDAIWGPALDFSEWNRRLTQWFQFFKEETTAILSLPTSNQIRNGPAVATTTQVLEIIALLNQQSQRTRQDLKKIWQASYLDSTIASTMPVVPLVDDAFDLTVRLLFMSVCRSTSTSNFITTGQVFKPRWKDEETLEQFISRVFPRYAWNSTQGTRIYPEKLTASYLENYVDVRIVWTDNLPDHLVLQHTSSGKYLYMFSNAGFLEACSSSSENLSNRYRAPEIDKAKPIY
jgi:hypothetical protein